MIIWAKQEQKRKSKRKGAKRKKASLLGLAAGPEPQSSLTLFRSGLCSRPSALAPFLGSSPIAKSRKKRKKEDDA